jgi:hypothetical protein
MVVVEAAVRFEADTRPEKALRQNRWRLSTQSPASPFTQFS